ncbi:DUF4377 domain-containing protein [Nocardia arizonensis]|uniref:DUF4377 domain-containing protein n=1 Tax=Nocardia arizonensis TaxID=1141647 RepID=UPI00138F54E3|nr:DUF4377 domain-containing protein [Nocardia arizonensis]
MPSRFRRAVAACALLPALAGCSARNSENTAAAPEPANAAVSFPVEVAPRTMRCVGVAPRECLQIRRSPNASWELFYATIEGFDFQPGFRYHLTVQEIPVPNPPADAAPVRWKLVEVLDKQPEN